MIQYNCLSFGALRDCDKRVSLTLTYNTLIGYILIQLARFRMLDEKHKKLVRDRLSRVQGQIGGVMKMVEADRYCVDILNQTSAIVSAIRNVENIVLENHLNTCVAEAMRSNDPDEQNEKTTEVMKIIGTYRR